MLTSDLVIFNNCLTLIEYLPQIQTDEKNPNDCANEPHELTHICDALRYFCVSRVSPSKETIIRQDDIRSFFEEKENYRYDYGEEIVVV